MSRILTVILLTSLLIISTVSGNSELNASGDKDWSIVVIYEVPEGASGLAFDGTYLYCGIYGSNGDEVYQIDRTDGSYVLQCSGPQEDAYGLTYDGTYLWTMDHPTDPSTARQFNFSGVEQSTFSLPTRYMSGIAYDNGDFWVTAYYPDPSTIYKVDNTGSEIKSFTAPDNQPWDLCMQNEFLWMADYWGDALYKIDTATGAMLESHDSEGTDPAGIVWDGTFLWYVDNGTGTGTSYDYLYKIDLSGAGTPQINVPTDEHDFGIITINESSTWDCSVLNTGTADLEITGLTFSGSTELSTTTTFPITLTPSEDTVISITFSPLIDGALNAAAFIACNDPLNPSYELLLTGDAVLPGPDINLPQSSHDYGSVRQGALTRWFITIENVGDDILSIVNISSDDPDFFIDAAVTYPIEIGLLSSVEVGIWFNPTLDMTYSANLTIYSNDPDESPLNVPLAGIGDPDPYPIGDVLWEYTITGSSYDNSPKSIISLPDINGDGVDEVIIGAEDDFIYCLNGNSHGTADVFWAHEISTGTNYSQNGLTTIEDIDEDGYPEVIVGAAWGSKFVRAISGRTGDEIWTYYTNEYGDGGWVYQVDCSFDYNSDGTVDVLAVSGDDAGDIGPKRVHCLDGLTGVVIWDRFLGGTGFGVKGVEDFNGDGHPDVIVGCTNEEETIGRAVGIDGATSLILWTFVSPGSSVWAVEQIDDITGDGIKDVVVGDFSVSGGNVFGLNATNGNQVWSRPMSGLVLRFEIMDDVNGNGYRDVLPAHAAFNANVIDGYTGDYIWTTMLADKSWNVSRCGDISGDGINDAMFGTLFTNNYVYFMDGVDGEELHSISMGAAVDALHSIPTIDGNVSDEMVAGDRSGNVYCFSGGLSGVVNTPPSTPTVDGPAEGIIDAVLEYEFLSIDPEAHDIYYYVEWGDGQIEDWIGPYASDLKVQVNHTYTALGTNTIRAKAKDQLGMESSWSENVIVTIKAFCGDASNDGEVNVSDAVWIINYVFVGGDPPNPYEAGDTDCSGSVDVSDAVWIINYVFVGGNDPCDTDGDTIPDC
jgi:HYDIN/CFA65/VesB-like, Ig-like domain/PQQ-like domain/Dockerin type I domain